MRKIIVLSFITLDGVMQTPDGPEENTSSDFKFGGWSAPYFQEAEKEIGFKMANQIKSADFLLGGKTFEIFESYWPEQSDYWPGINDATKYVVSNMVTRSDWKNSVFLQNVDDIKKIKKTEGPSIHVHGSSNLVQTLLKQDLVDELWLKIFPMTKSIGKRLLDKGIISSIFTLKRSFIASNGVIFANYARTGVLRKGKLLKEKKTEYASLINL